MIKFPNWVIMTFDTTVSFYSTYIWIDDQHNIAGFQTYLIFLECKVISKVKQKQRSWWQVQHETPKSGPVFIVKVVDSVVIEANLFYKSSSISSKYYFYSIKKFISTIKKTFCGNVQFQWVLKSYYLTKI